MILLGLVAAALGIGAGILLGRSPWWRSKADARLPQPASSGGPFSDVFENGPLGMALVDSNFHILRVNSALCAMLGYTQSELVTHTFLEFSHPEDTDVSAERVRRVFEGELTHYQVERRYVRRDGSTLWANLTVSAILAPKQTTLVLGVLEDITERKRVEEALRESESKNRALLHAVPDPIFRLTGDGVCVDYIPAKGFETPATSAGFLGRSVSEILPQELADEATRVIRRSLSTGSIQTFEYDHPLDGTLRRLEARIVPDGQEHVLAVIRDISERAQAERALRESEQRLRTLVEHAPEALVILDVDTGRFIDVNRHAVELFGRSREELLRMGPVHLSPPTQPDGSNSNELAKQFIEEALAGRLPVYDWVHRHSSGRSVPCEIRLVRLPSAGRRLIRGSLIDITERREVAEALRASRDGLRAVFDASPLPTLMLDRDGFVRMWNSAAQRTFGWTADEVIGWRPPIVPPNRLEEFNALRLRVLSGEPVRNVETQRLAKDGQTIDVSLSAAPLADRNGAVIGIVNALVDITPRKRAERAVRESEAKYRALVEHATYGIFRASRNGQFLAVNPALAEMLQYESEAALAEVDIAQDIYVDHEHWDRMMRRLERIERIDGVEAKWMRKDETVITVRLSGRAVRSVEGHVDAVEMIAEDVTKQRALESQLRHAQKMEAIGQLTGGIAHDFNNILTAVLSNAELIQGGLPKEAQALRSEVDDIRAAARRGAAMIRKLMAFSRREHLDIHRLDLGEVVEELAPMLRRLLPEHIEVKVLRHNVRAVVRADRGAIEQIVLNLATNARDAMPDGGALRIETRITTLDEQYRSTYGWGEPGDYVCLAVHDTGMGIDDAVRGKIFEPFFTTKPPGEGTGLGMAMVYGLVKQHGGFINVDSEVGQGTAVRMYFPVDRSVDPIDVPAQHPSDVRGGTEAILLVEDEEAIRRACQRVLQRFGYTVRVAADGQEALAVLRNQDIAIDLVITDVVMPKLGGRKLHEAARAAGLNVKFVFTSGYAARDMRDSVELDPMLPFLHKPWTVVDLLKRVREVLDHPENADEATANAPGPRDQVTID